MTTIISVRLLSAQRLVVVLDECLPCLSWFVFPVRVFQSVGGLEFGPSPCFFAVIYAARILNAFSVGIDSGTPPFLMGNSEDLLCTVRNMH